MRVPRLVSLSLVMLLSMLALPMGTAAQGNSEAPHACQGEGYLDYTDADGNGFKNAGQCTRYAARDGELYPVATLNVEWPFPGSEDGWLRGTGLQPGAPVYFGRQGYPSQESFTVAPDGTIDVVLDSPAWVWCGFTDPHFHTRTRTGEVIRTYENLGPPCHHG